MTKLETIYQQVIQLFQTADVDYQSWEHEPILDFATDERIARELGWTGTHSKSLFLKIKGGGHALYLTEKDNRLDRKTVQAALGKRISICSNEEMTEITGCVPGAVCPFGLPEGIPILVDQTLFTKTEILFTPAHPELTFSFAGEALPKLLKLTANPIHLI